MSKVVIIVDNSYFEENLELLKDKKVISLFSHLCKTIENSDVSLPIASFYEKSGTYTNCDGIEQKVVSKIKKDNQSLTVTSVLEHLKEMIVKGTL